MSCITKIVCSKCYLLLVLIIIIIILLHFGVFGFIKKWDPFGVLDVSA